MPVARLVHTNLRLRLLDLGWNSLGDEGCALIAAQLKANNALVQVLMIGPTVLIIGFGVLIIGLGVLLSGSGY